MKSSVVESCGKHKSKIIAGIITFVVIALIVMAGPASAFVANLAAFSDSLPKQNTVVSSQFDVEMNAAERADVNQIDLYADGSVICSFEASGTVIGTCDEATLTKLTSTADYGYNYGYGYGYGDNSVASKLSYTLAINTSTFDIGTHTFNIVVASNNVADMVSGEQKIIVSSQGDAVYAETIPVSTLDGTKNDDLNASISLQFVDGGTGDLVIEKYNSLPEGTSSFSIPALGVYLVIDESGITGAIANTTEIRVYYTDEQLAAAGIDEGTLKLYYYDAGTWNSPISSGVDTVNNYVWAFTDHFSSWGVFGSAVVVTDSSDSSSHGHGSCVTTYTCGEWGSCVDGFQTRECTKMNPNCYSYASAPLDKKACTVAAAEANTATQKLGGRIAGITGAVIGALGTAGTIGVIIFIILVLIALVLVFIKRRKN